MNEALVMGVHWTKSNTSFNSRQKLIKIVKLVAILLCMKTN